MSTTETNPICNQCGKCCISNGLIPPFLFGELGEDDPPEWLVVMVNRLRDSVAYVAEKYQCVFLTDDCRCAINEHKPMICRDFLCDNIAANAAGGE